MHVEKVRLRHPFPRVERCFPLAPMGLPGGKQRKETLLRKASESAAHVAGFGLHLEGYGPPNLPEGFFDSLGVPQGTLFFCVQTFQLSSKAGQENRSEACPAGEIVW